MSFVLPEIIRGVPRGSAEFAPDDVYPRSQTEMKAWEANRSADLHTGLSAEIRDLDELSGFRNVGEGCDSVSCATH